MTDEPPAERRGRSLRDDLLHDLQQGTPRPPTPTTPAPAPHAEPRPPFAAPAVTPSVELRITPRSWSPLAWTSSARGFVVSAGPVRLSLGRAAS
jgi:hypothetical protein